MYAPAVTNTPPREPQKPDAPLIDWRTTHLWQIQWVRDLLVLALVFSVVWLGYRLSTVTVPMLLALMLAYLVEPIVRRITVMKIGGRRRFSRPGVAVLLILGATVLVALPLTLGVGYAAVQGAGYAANIADDAGKLKRALDTPTDASLQRELRGGWKWIFERATELIDGPASGEMPAAPTEGGAADAHSSGIGQRALAAVRERREIQAVFRRATDWVSNNADQLGKQVVGAGTTAVGAAARGAGWLGVLGFSAFLTGFFFFFFCTGYGKLLRFWESLIPERQRSGVVTMLGKMDRVIAGFVRGRLTICAILTIYYAIAYATIGVPAWTVIGVVVGLLTLVPYAAGAAVPFVMLLLWLNAPADGLASHWYWIVGAPIVCLVIQQLMDDYILTPWIQGDATGMDTPSILFASIAGGILAGFYGLLLAIPVAACLKIVITDLFLPRLRAWAAGKEEDMLPIGRE